MKGALVVVRPDGAAVVAIWTGPPGPKSQVASGLKVSVETVPANRWDWRRGLGCPEARRARQFSNSERKGTQTPTTSAPVVVGARGPSGSEPLYRRLFLAFRAPALLLPALSVSC